MATVHICDRCGAEIPLYDKSHHLVGIFNTSDAKVKVGLPYDDRYEYKDLCDNCIEILLLTMNKFMKTVSPMQK